MIQLFVYCAVILWYFDSLCGNHNYNQPLATCSLKNTLSSTQEVVVDFLGQGNVAWQKNYSLDAGAFMTISKESHTWIMNVSSVEPSTHIEWVLHAKARVWEACIVAQQQHTDASCKALELEDAFAFDLGYAELRQDKLKSLAAEFGGETFLPARIKAMFGNKRLPQGLTRADLLNKVETLYKDFYADYKAELKKQPDARSTKPRIPHLVHHIWFGSPMPENYRVWKTRWKKLHPGWKHICWNEEMLKKHFPDGLVNQKAFDDAKKVKNYAKMSDIVRYEILYAFGGIYADSDLQPYASFNALHEITDFYAGLEEFRIELELGNAIIGACAEHPILKHCIDIIGFYQQHPPDMKDWDLSHNTVSEVNKTLVTTGPVLLTRAFLERGGQPGKRDVVLPAIYLYGTNVVHPEVTLCKHFFDDSWISLLSFNPTS